MKYVFYLLLTLVRWCRLDFRGSNQLYKGGTYQDVDGTSYRTWTKCWAADLVVGDIVTCIGCDNMELVVVKPPELWWWIGRWSVLTLTMDEWLQVQGGTAEMNKTIGPPRNP